MTSNTLTLLRYLRVGDTFTKTTGGTIYEVKETPRLARGVRYCRKGSLKLTDMLDEKTEVIFLKHADKV